MNEASVIRFDNGVSNQGINLSILSLTESGSGGEFDIDTFKPPAVTIGASQVAGSIQDKVFRTPYYITAAASCYLFNSMIAVPIQKGEVSLRETEYLIKAALEMDPIEDGFSHSAEVYIENAVEEYGDYVGSWLINILSDDFESHCFKADMLRLFSRMNPFTEELRYRIIQRGLSSSYAEVRDATVQAAESWEDNRLVPLLKEHTEACPWLAEYISQVIRDLTI
ncbi:hypothetical protein JXQ70_17195 [bacterium]|nr:hypothetical protein [bacterium]